MGVGSVVLRQVGAVEPPGEIVDAALELAELDVVVRLEHLELFGVLASGKLLKIVIERLDHSELIRRERIFVRRSNNHCAHPQYQRQTDALRDPPNHLVSPLRWLLFTAFARLLGSPLGASRLGFLLQKPLCQRYRVDGCIFAMVVLLVLP